MENSNYNDKGGYRQKAPEPVFSSKFRAGRRRTYFFDIRATRQNDYYLTITESKKRMDGGYDRHKIFLYKEDFNKFLEFCTQSVNHVKTELMPDYDYDEFSRKQEEWERSHEDGQQPSDEMPMNDAPEAAPSNEAPRIENVNPAPDPEPNADDLKW